MSSLRRAPQGTHGGEVIVHRRAGVRGLVLHFGASLDPKSMLCDGWGLVSLSPPPFLTLAHLQKYRLAAGANSDTPLVIVGDGQWGCCAVAKVIQSNLSPMIAGVVLFDPQEAEEWEIGAWSRWARHARADKGFMLVASLDVELQERSAGSLHAAIFSSREEARASVYDWLPEVLSGDLPTPLLPE